MITLNNKYCCENCFSEITTEPCPHCGFVKSAYRQDPVALSLGSILNQRYLIGGVVGKGGFGITYLAYDLKLDSRLAVKEYYPMGLAIRNPGSITVSVSNGDSVEPFKNGAEKFYNEAKMVAKFNGNPNIVSVHDFFYENETVYFVMGYLEGQTLKSYIKKKKISEGQAVGILNQISNALLASHSMNILHRDVSPDNIMLCTDGSIRLLDFGAARQVMAEQSQGLSVILKQGFAPLEQYQKKGKQGPWTDIYALGSTVYNALTGDMLSDPMTRLEDDSEFESNKYGISEPLWNVISKCTQLKIPDRYQDIAELKEDLQNIGIEVEKFTDVDEEITDLLKGKVPKAYDDARVSGGQASPSQPMSQAQPMSQVQPMPQVQPMSQIQPMSHIQPMPQARSMPQAQSVSQAGPMTPAQPMPQAQPVSQARPMTQSQPVPNYMPQAQPMQQKKTNIVPIIIIGALFVLFLIIIAIVVFSLVGSANEKAESASESLQIEDEWDTFEYYFGIDILDLEDIDDETSESEGIPKGVYVYAVKSPGAAYDAGIEEGDIITGYNGQKIESWLDLENLVLGQEEGDSVDITVERYIDGEYQTLEGPLVIGGE